MYVSEVDGANHIKIELHKLFQSSIRNCAYKDSFANPITYDF